VTSCNCSCAYTHSTAALSLLAHLSSLLHLRVDKCIQEHTRHAHHAPHNLDSWGILPADNDGECDHHHTLRSVEHGLGKRQGWEVRREATCVHECVCVCVCVWWSWRVAGGNAKW